MSASCGWFPFRPTPTKPPFILFTQASARESQSRSESKNAFPAVLATEGRVVGLCWEKLQSNGPKAGFHLGINIWGVPFVYQVF